MSRVNPNKGKHLTLDDRIEIQDCLNHGIVRQLALEEREIIAQSLAEGMRVLPLHPLTSWKRLIQS